jgi:signal transduction histidine kinase
MSLGKRIAISIFAILLLFSINIGTYFWSNEQRNIGLVALQKAISSQLRANEAKQLLENKHKEVLVLKTLKETTLEPLEQSELDYIKSGIDDITDKLGSLHSFSSPQTLPTLDAALQEFVSLSEIWQHFLASYNSVMEPYDAEQLTDAYQKVFNGISEYQRVESRNAEDQAVQINSTIELTSKINVLVFLSSIFLTSTLGFVLIRYTNNSLLALKEGVRHVSEGNLDYRIPEFSRDELGELAAAFNNMSGRLKQAIAQVQRAKDNADRANQAKSIFLANMSHELRTPLAAITGYSELVAEEIEEDPDIRGEALVEDVEKITIAGKQLVELIQDILDISKIESGKMQLNNEWFDANQSIRDAATTVQPIANKNGNTLHLELEAGTPQLFCDRTKFRQVISNLLSNACKFTSHGEITVRDKILSVDDKEFVEYSVTDTGIGMDEEQTSRIFESFVQADLSTTKKYGGTGLGLTISKQFCELMGGSINVESEPGVGTTFWIRLPLARTPLSQ